MDINSDNLFDVNEYDNIELPTSISTITSSPKIKEENPYLKTILNTQKQSIPYLEENSENINKKQKLNSSLSDSSISSDDINQIKIEKFLNTDSIVSSDIKSAEPLEKTNEEIKDNNQPQSDSKTYAVEDEIDIREFDKIPSYAVKFPFILDDFQKRSIIRLERHQNVLVCAHTSSGKTVVAEYGIALGKQNKKRVLYTSPIKALSNQKYREFKHKFGDAGIWTGDVSINPDAQCLIMTTEILQNSLYKNSEWLNSVEWVVFDEVHYINDKERGHVWEEILIWLPPQIGIIMLSATVPNYFDFAKWVGKIKKTTIFIQNTLKRIVPLQHKIYWDKDNVFLSKDKNNIIYENDIQTAIGKLQSLKIKEKNKRMNKRYSQMIRDKEQQFSDNIEYYNQFKRGENEKKNFQNQKGRYGNKGGIKISKMHFKIEEVVAYLQSEKWCPAVIFVFSIKRINEYAKCISSTPLVDQGQKFKILSFFDNCINSTLSPIDKAIPQIIEVRVLLSQGIGMHHSGWLPILKEIIEIWYSKGLIPILFATTSFSIGLNMPTRTVVFTEIYKFNDETKEILSSSEYLQMCGRAGRRGIDDIGNVFLIITDQSNENEADEIIQMLKGTGTEVESNFRLSYRTIISFYSRNIKKIKEFFKESFLENMNINAIPQLEKEIKELKLLKSKVTKIDCKEIEDSSYIESYSNVLNDLLATCNELFSFNVFDKQIKCQNKCCRFVKVYDSYTGKIVTGAWLYYYINYQVLWILTIHDKKPNKIIYETNTKLKYKGVQNNIYFEYNEYPVGHLIDIYNYSYNCMHDPAMQNDYIFLHMADMKNVLYFLKNRTSELNSIDYLKISGKDAKVYKWINKKEDLEKELRNHPCYNCPRLQEHWVKYEEIENIKLQIKEKEDWCDPQKKKHREEFKTRTKILQKLGYWDDQEVITLRGKASREIATTDCILISELLFRNILEPLSKDEIIAFWSGFASNKNEIDLVNPNISSEFTSAFDKFSDWFNEIVEIEASFDFEENKYNRRMTFSISKAMMAWMSGQPFYAILQETELDEGKWYNLIMRIYLFLEEIINFYGVSGNKKWSEKYEEIKKTWMRDIMSTQSLYWQDSINIDNI